jgi:hypothetical protein
MRILQVARITCRFAIAAIRQILRQSASADEEATLQAPRMDLPATEEHRSGIEGSRTSGLRLRTRRAAGPACVSVLGCNAGRDMITGEEMEDLSGMSG